MENPPVVTPGRRDTRQAASRRPHEPEVVETAPRAEAGSGEGRAVPRAPQAGRRARRRLTVEVLRQARSTPRRLHLQLTAIAVAAATRELGKAGKGRTWGRK